MSNKLAGQARLKALTAALDIFFKKINPFNASCSKLLLFEAFSAILVLPAIFNFWHSGALALNLERQSAWMSKFKNGGLDQYGKV